MKKLFTLLCSLIATTAFAQFLGAGKGTESNPYQIENTEQFNSLRGIETSGKYFVLTADIDMTEWLMENNPKNGWNPIPNFSGNLDGQNHFVKTYINRQTTNYVALFQNLSQAFISNLNLIVDYKGKNYVAGLCASTTGYSRIANCSISGTIEGVNYVGGLIGYDKQQTSLSCCTSTVEIKGEDNVGGVIAFSSGKISQCHFSGNLYGNTNCGGIAGRGDHGQNDSYYYSHYYIGSIFDSMNSGSINGKGEHIGGIAGYVSYNHIERCLNKGTISGESKVGGIAGGIFGFLAPGSYNSELYSNVSVGTIIASTDYAGRIAGDINEYVYVGDLGSSKENKSLNTLSVIVNGEEQEIDGDDALNGSNYGPRTLKQASAYTSIGWDMGKVWTINSGQDYPTLFLEPMGTPNFKSEYEEVAAPTISVGEGTISFSCELNDPTYYYRISFNEESYKFSSTKEPVALPTSFTLSVYATGEGLTTPTTVENIELSQLLNDGNLNGDDTIDITDVTILVNKILEKAGESEE